MTSPVNFNFRLDFFDSEKVIRAVKKSERANLSKAGAFVRTTARRSMRLQRKKRPSDLGPEDRRAYEARAARARANGEPLPYLGRMSAPPGKPPGMKAGHLRDYLFFAWDQSTRSVVVGPMRLRQRSPVAGIMSIPEVLEKGGTSWAGTLEKPRKIVVAARPYMQPALLKEMPKFPDLWRNSVK